MAQPRQNRCRQIQVAQTASTGLAYDFFRFLRRPLIGQGVDAKKIRAFYNSAGGFVADNSTPEGRAKNRRVDIELVNTKLAKLSQATTQLAKK